MAYVDSGKSVVVAFQPLQLFIFTYIERSEFVAKAMQAFQLFIIT